MDSSYFQKFYEFEMEQRNVAATLVNVPLVAFTALASGMSVMLVDFQYTWTMPSYLFGSFIVVALMSLLAGLCCMGKSLIVEPYQKLPNLQLLKAHSDGLRAYWRSQLTSEDEALRNAANDFQEYMNGQFAEAAVWNSRVNGGRGAWMHRALICAAVAAASLIPAGGFYVYNKTSAPDKIFQVKVLSGHPIQTVQFFSEPDMSQNTNNPATPAQSPTPQPSQPAPLQSTPIAKPVGPVNEFFKSTTVPVKPDFDSGKK